MWDYNINKLKEKNPKLYVQKMLTYRIWHGEKIDKELCKKYIDEVDIDENTRELVYFALGKINGKDLVK